MERYEKLKILREAVNISRPQMFRDHKIKVRTLEDWEYGKNEMPEYAAIYIAERLRATIKEKGLVNMVVNDYGTIVDFDAAVQLMDDEIREHLHDEMAPCDDQEFFEAYCKAHVEKFGEEFELAKENPVY